MVATSVPPVLNTAQDAAPAQARVGSVREQQVWPLILLAMALADGIILSLAGVIAYHARFCNQFFDACGPARLSHAHSYVFYAKVLGLYVPLTMLLYLVLGAYRRRDLFRGTQEYQTIANATGLATLLTSFISYLTYQHSPIARGWLLLAWVLGAGMVMVGRFSMRRVLRLLHARGILTRAALVVGSGKEAQLLEWHLYRARQEGIQVLGYVDSRLEPGAEVAGGRPILGSIDDLPGLIAEHQVELVLVATADLTQDEALRALQRVLPTPADVALAPDLFRTLTTDGHLLRVGGDPLLLVDKVRITGLNACLKGVLDLCLALLLLILTLPLWAAIAIAIRITAPGPLFEGQWALGEGGRPFKALKFRTTAARRTNPPAAASVSERRLRGLPVREEPDVTRLGRMLRRYSLDELPQLLNVLRLQMSLVGPYKISPDQVSLYGARQFTLLTVKPGLTGVCQVHGRGELTVEERSLLDAEYVRTYSIWRDLQILIATIPAVLHGRGAY